MDESGKPNYSDPENYVLSSLIIHEHNWQLVDNQVNQLKMKHFPTLNPDKIEFHTKEIVCGEKIFKTKNFDERFSILKDIYNLIANIDCTIISVLINKSRRYNDNFDCEHWGMQLLFERLCSYLEKQNAAKLADSLPSESGILLIDSINQTYDMSVRQRLLPWIRDGTSYCKNHWIIEDPIFVNSSYRNLSQLVDATAYCVRRKHRPSSGRVDIAYDEFFDTIFPKFDKDKNDNVMNAGLKIFP